MQRQKLRQELSCKSQWLKSWHLTARTRKTCEILRALYTFQSSLAWKAHPELAHQAQGPHFECWPDSYRQPSRPNSHLQAKEVDISPLMLHHISAYLAEEYPNSAARFREGAVSFKLRSLMCDGNFHLRKGTETIVVSRCKQTTAALFTVIQALQNCPTLFAAEDFFSNDPAPTSWLVCFRFSKSRWAEAGRAGKTPYKKASVDISLLLVRFLSLPDYKAPHFDLVSAAVLGNQPLGRCPLDTKQVAWCCGDRCTKGRTEFHCAPWANG